MRKSTDYRSQKNRCFQCGHKASMHKNGHACQVENGAENDNSFLIPCTCKRLREMII